MDIREPTPQPRGIIQRAAFHALSLGRFPQILPRIGERGKEEKKGMASWRRCVKRCQEASSAAAVFSKRGDIYPPPPPPDADGCCRLSGGSGACSQQTHEEHVLLGGGTANSWEPMRDEDTGRARVDRHEEDRRRPTQPGSSPLTPGRFQMLGSATSLSCSLQPALTLGVVCG